MTLARAHALPESAATARFLGLTYLAAATLGALSMVLPQPPGTNHAGIWAVLGTAFALGALVLASARRNLRFAAPVALATGTILVTLGTWFTGQPTTLYPIFYVWVALVAGYCLKLPAVLGQVTVVAVGYGVLIAAQHPPTPAERWLVVVGTVLITGLLVAAMRRRTEALLHDRRRREEILRAQTRALSLMREVRGALAREQERAPARAMICRAACQAASADVALLWEPTPDQDGLRVSASTRSDLEPLIVPFTAERSVLVHAVRDGRPHFVADATRPGDTAASPELADVQSCFVQPVVHGATTVAVLWIGWCRPRGEAGQSLRDTIALFAADAALTIEREDLLERLSHAARTDELTGLPNRRAWQQQLPVEVARSEREQTPLTIAMLDLDHFKAYNDRHGHQHGDTLLQQTSHAWRRELRTTDMLARYGGEEFALLLPGCSQADALHLVERLRASTPHGQTVSAGLATWLPSEDAEGFVGRADAALYEAKRRGRDRAVCAT